MKKCTIIAMMVLLMGCLLPQAAVAAPTEVGLKVNDSWVSCDASTGAPYINDSGRTMVPLRVVNDYLDYTTDWTSDGRIRITGRDGAVDVTVQVGSTDYTANGEAGQFGTAPLVREDGRTYLPVRDFGELYGSVYWDGTTRFVWLSDSPTPAYQIIRDQLLRATKDAIEPVAMPEDWELYGGAAGDSVSKVTALDGKNYVLISRHQNVSYQMPLFRDDGAFMTYVVTMNGTSSFAVLGDIIYHTMGTSDATMTSYIVPERLYATPIGNDDARVSYTLDFAINECDLSMEDGKLIATAPDGTRRTVDFSTLMPDAE